MVGYYSDGKPNGENLIPETTFVIPTKTAEGGEDNIPGAGAASGGSIDSGSKVAVALSSILIIVMTVMLSIMILKSDNESQFWIYLGE